MNVAELLETRPFPIGSQVSLSGILMVDGEADWLAPDLLQRETLDRCVLIEQRGFWRKLDDNVPAAIGGRYLYMNPAVIVGTLSYPSSELGFPLALRNIISVEVEDLRGETYRV